MTFDRLTSLFLLCLCCDVIRAQGHTKVWTMPQDKFVNFGKDDINCINQTYIYQKEGGLYVTLPEQVNTIILPSTGAVMFQQNQEIKFTARKAQCHSDSYNANHFKLHIIQPMSWFNTDNWQIKGRTQHQNRAIPHIDRIPCECDDVEFSTNQSLWIDMDYMSEMVVKQVKINDRTDDLSNFLETGLGQSMFMHTYFGTFKEGMCEDTKSCGCHSPAMFAEYLETVCLNSEVCHEPNCLEPIQPIGHCCPICGGAIQINVNRLYCMTDIHSANEYMQLTTLMHDEFAGKVDAYIGMVRGAQEDDIKLQIVAVDREEYNEHSVGFINKMYNDNRFFGAFKSEGDVMRLLFSGQPHIPNSPSSTWFIVFSSLLMVLSMFGTVYLYYSDDSKLRKYNPFNRLRVFTSPFVFARFDNTRDDDAQSIAVGVEFEEPQPTTSIYETLVSAFDNPMFKAKKEKKIETIGPNVLNNVSTDGDDGESVASVKLVEVGLDSSEES
ncbi:protein amnionless [Bradysia coprophila]|uniref:protein amnionless n=1 Tax=Bradysia coprophila TaxID=38358 RepID=UPI00187D7FA9|nr:protein amnionless [Bradysia coprophila]